MSAVATSPDTNFWFDKRCARAFWSQCELPPYRELLEHTTLWMAPEADEDWLDLGCGSGQLTQAIWEKSAGKVGSVVAVDCAMANGEPIGKLAHELTPEDLSRLRFRQIDFSHGLPAFSDASFDGVVSGLSIQYAQYYSTEKGCWTTDAYDNLLREVLRVLRPGGRFVFSVNVPNPNWWRVAFSGIPSFFKARKPFKFFRNSMRMMRYGKWLKQEAARGRFHYLESSVILDKLRQAGFERIEHRVSYARQAFLFRGFRAS